MTVTRADKFSMVVHGEGEDRLDRSKDNLVVRMTEKVLQSLDKEVILFLHPPTHISHMSHPTFPISHLLFCAEERISLAVLPSPTAAGGSMSYTSKRKLWNRCV